MKGRKVIKLIAYIIFLTLTGILIMGCSYDNQTSCEAHILLF